MLKKSEQTSTGLKLASGNLTVCYRTSQLVNQTGHRFQFANPHWRVLPPSPGNLRVDLKIERPSLPNRLSSPSPKTMLTKNIWAFRSFRYPPNFQTHGHKIPWWFVHRRASIGIRRAGGATGHVTSIFFCEVLGDSGWNHQFGDSLTIKMIYLYYINTSIKYINILYMCIYIYIHI